MGGRNGLPSRQIPVVSNFTICSSLPGGMPANRGPRAASPHSGGKVVATKVRPVAAGRALARLGCFAGCDTVRKPRDPLRYTCHAPSAFCHYHLGLCRLSDPAHRYRPKPVTLPAVPRPLKSSKVSLALSSAPLATDTQRDVLRLRVIAARRIGQAG